MKTLKRIAMVALVIALSAANPLAGAAVAVAFAAYIVA